MIDGRNSEDAVFQAGYRCPDCFSTFVRWVDSCAPPVENSGGNNRHGAQYAKKLYRSDLVFCRACGLYFRWPLLDADDLVELYRSVPAEYWSETVNPPASWHLARKLLEKQFSNESEPAILDVGAFSGGFLASLPAAWTKYAIEPSKRAVQSLESRDIRVIGGFLQDENLDKYEQSFDAIVLLDVFEHLQHPTLAFKVLGRLTRPGGSIIISTGSPDHWSWKMLKGKHWYLHSIQHCCFADRRFIRQLSVRNGFVVSHSRKHSHMSSDRSVRIRQFLEIVLYLARQNSAPWSKLAYQLTRTSMLRHMRHKTAAPFTNELRDHVIYCLVKS